MFLASYIVVWFGLVRLGSVPYVRVWGFEGVMAYVYVIVQACEARNVMVLGEYCEVCYAGTSVLHGLDLVLEGLYVAESEGVEESEVDWVVSDAFEVFLVIAENVNRSLIYLSKHEGISCFLKPGEKARRDVFCGIQAKSID